jgi:hypothetical protein
MHVGAIGAVRVAGTGGRQRCQMREAWLVNGRLDASIVESSK